MRDWELVLQTAIEGPVTRWANCLKVTRQDTVVFGFTSHLIDLVVDGVTYEAAIGLEPSPLQNTVGTGIDHSDFQSVVRSGRITAEEIRAGVWDGADVELFWLDWNDPEGGQGDLLTGSFGEIKEEEGRFTVELHSLSQRYAQQIGKECSLTCRVRNFPDDCFISEAGAAGTNYDGTQTVGEHKYSGAIVSDWSAATPRLITFDGPTTPVGGELKASNYYRWGKVLFETGDNAGFSMDVKQHTIAGGTAVIELQRSFPYPVALGDTALLTAGCDRTLSMCAGTYENAGNADFEPHVPGPDALLRTGRKAEPLDRFQGLRSRVVR